jgi:hypothetical protein
MEPSPSVTEHCELIEGRFLWEQLACPLFPREALLDTRRRDHIQKARYLSSRQLVEPGSQPLRENAGPTLSRETLNEPLWINQTRKITVRDRIALV